MSPTGPIILVLFLPRERTPFSEGVSSETLRLIMESVAMAGGNPIAIEFSPYRLEQLFQKYGGIGTLNLVYGYVDPKSGVCLDQPTTSELITKAGFQSLGSTFDVQHLTQDKLECGEFLRACGYRTPSILGVHNMSSEFMVRKPRFGAAHRNMAIVHSQDMINEDSMPKPPYREILQEYISLPEYTVGVVETVDGLYAFPPLRMKFAANEPCLMQEGIKWKVIPDMKDKFDLRRTACAIFRDIGMRDYGRIDFRVANNIPVVLDVNSLPNLDPKRSYLPIAARYGGYSYHDLIAAIVRRVLTVKSSVDPVKKYDQLMS